MTRERSPAAAARRLARLELPEAFVAATIASAARATYASTPAGKREASRLERKVRRLAEIELGPRKP